MTAVGLISTAVIAGASVSAVSAGRAADPSSITLAQVNRSAAASTLPGLGTTVSFSTTYPRTVKNPRIEVLCYQGGSLVYGEAGDVAQEFLLGGGWSIWLGQGGPADCTANLFYFGSHAGQQTYVVLASTAFSASG